MHVPLRAIWCRATLIVTLAMLAMPGTARAQSDQSQSIAPPTSDPGTRPRQSAPPRPSAGRVLPAPAPSGRRSSRPAPPPADAMAVPGRPGWFVDTTNGCWIWNATLQSAVTVSWSGICPGGPASGYGTIEWRWEVNGQPRAERFIGPLQEGRMNGRGIYTAHNGNEYDGEWRENVRNGRGRLSLPNGDSYNGEWRDDRQAGNGFYGFAGGSHYEGEWRDGRPDGNGRYYDTETGSFHGTWRGGCFREGSRLAAIGRPLDECR